MPNPVAWTRAAVAACLLAGPAAAGCASDPEACKLGNRSYDIELPEKPAPNSPALVYLHGFGGSGQGALRNRVLVDAALDRGYAVVAPTGLPMTNGRRGFRWAFRGADQSEEIAFLKDLVKDLETRFAIGADHVVLSGFSNGAFMVAYLACQAPDTYAAYAAIAGGFWRPDPKGCAGPVRLHMTHGWTDGVVPLEGRILRGTSRDDPNAVIQGDIFRTLEIFREANDCARNRPQAYDMTSDFWVRSWTDCADGAALDFALHQGGHGVPAGWTDLMIDWFEAKTTAQ